MIETNRRSLIKGLIAFAAAPMIVRAESLMPIKVIKPDYLILPPGVYVGEWLEQSVYIRGNIVSLDGTFQINLDEGFVSINQKINMVAHNFDR